MVNWGNLPNGEFDFGPVNLFSGGNGSGKTTAADMIQTLMTAAHENLFQYNPGQDETTQKGKGGKKVRTLASYVLGCDDGSYARMDATDGYMAATFNPTKGEIGEAFTALIGVRAWLESAGKNRLARQDELVFYILTQQQNRALRLADLQPEGAVLTLDTLQGSLIQLFGKSAVEKYDTKRAYLRRLYGVFRGKKDAVTEIEAMNAAKAFSRFMAYKPVQSINRFVADEILEKKDLGEAIRSISEQLKTIHGMEADATRIQESVDVLEGAMLSGQTYVEAWRDLQVSRYTIAKHAYLVRQKDYLKAKEKEKNYCLQHNELDREIEINTQRVEQLHEQRVSLEAQRMGIAALQQKDELEKQREVQNRLLGQIGINLLKEGQSLDVGVAATREMVKLLNYSEVQAELSSFLELSVLNKGKSLLKLNPDSVLNVQDLVGADILNDIQGLEIQLDDFRSVQTSFNQWHSIWFESKQGLKPLSTQLVNHIDRLEVAYQQAGKEQQQKERIVEKLEKQKVAYPEHVERALLAIVDVCPQADPRVLCDHVEVSDEKWHAAIEGYLGGARFSIMVDEAYEAEAIKIVRALPGRHNKARIIQGKKAEKDAQRVVLDKQSICHVMKFTHVTAKNFTVASYGNVLRVHDEQALRTTRRGLTVECIASGNYAMFRCDIKDSDLVFGVEARKRALLSQREELEKITCRWNALNQRIVDIEQLNEQVNQLTLINLAEQLCDALGCRRELQKLENLISQIDLSDHKELENKLANLSSEETSRIEDGNLLIENRGKLKNKIETLTRGFKRLSDEQASTLQTVEGCEEELRRLLAIWPEFDIEAHLDRADVEAKSLKTAATESLLKEQESLLYRSERQLDEGVKSHNQICLPGDAIVYDSYSGEWDLALFERVVKLQGQIDNIFNRLKNNVLLEKHQQLKQLKDSFNHTFVSNLCHSIHQAINDGKRQIELLNNELESHQFGDDRETFRFGYEWVPEFREYARFFEEVIKNPELNDGQTLFAAKLKKSSIEIRDRMMLMLLEEDSDKALRELSRIADYRNYRQYEIYKEVEGKPSIALSEYGTGSGGQLETPAYIIRAAAITSAFKFAEGRCHLRTVLVDEAFSKMDETRSREVINYLTESLGLQLVFIMPSSKCGPFMDLISNEFIFAKCPSPHKRGELKTRVLVDRKVCNQEKIKALWANHKRTVHRQAELDFLSQLVLEES